MASFPVLPMYAPFLRLNHRDCCVLFVAPNLSPPQNKVVFTTKVPDRLYGTLPSPKLRPNNRRHILMDSSIDGHRRA